MPSPHRQVVLIGKREVMQLCEYVHMTQKRKKKVFMQKMLTVFDWFSKKSSCFTAVGTKEDMVAESVTNHPT